MRASCDALHHVQTLDHTCRLKNLILPILNNSRAGEHFHLMRTERAERRQPRQQNGTYEGCLTQKTYCCVLIAAHTLASILSCVSAPLTPHPSPLTGTPPEQAIKIVSISDSTDGHFPQFLMDTHNRFFLLNSGDPLKDMAANVGDIGKMWKLHDHTGVNYAFPHTGLAVFHTFMKSIDW